MTASDLTVEELVAHAAKGVVVSCGPRLLDGKIKAGEPFILNSVSVSLYLEDRDELGSLRWRVKFDGPVWAGSAIVRNSEEGWDDQLTERQYSWPHIGNIEEDVAFSGGREQAAEWLRLHSSSVGFDWGVDTSERERAGNLEIAKYAAIGVGIVFLMFLLG